MEKVYGPYTRKDGRKHVIHHNPDTRKNRTQSWPRYLMERYLGRELSTDEQVDHIDGDYTNDDINNLQILTFADHIIKTNESREKAKTRTCICLICGVQFEVLERRYKDNQIKQGKAGPYCSRSCAGIASHGQ